MKTPTLFAPDGRPITLEKRIGKGGEGEVYTIAGNARTVVKYYTLKDLTARREKIEAMIRAGLSDKSPLVAFPLAIVKNDRGQFAGFAMTRIDAHKPIHELYSPASRRAMFPQADYRFLARVATNVARSIASVHQTTCVIGDINHSGILVSDKATVTLIDADSFQIVDAGKPYLCTVGVPDFTPPELHGKRLDNVLRTENHDRFGLAVVIFQLLFMGKHPFSGRYNGGEMPMARSIEEMRFAYSMQRNTGMSPPPAAPLLGEFPVDMQNAFEVAFGPQGLTRRPTAADWVHLSADLEQNLKRCGTNALHYYSSHAHECPWCRMDRTQGTQLFIRPFNGGQTDIGGFSEIANVTSIWAHIESIKAPGTAPQFPPLLKPSVSPGPAPRKIKTENWQRKLSGAAIFGGGWLLITYAAQWFVVAFGMFVWGLVLFFANSKGKTEIYAKARDIEERWQKAIAEWQLRSDGYEFSLLKNQLAKAKQELADIPAKEKRRLDHYQQNRRAAQLKTFLESFRIRQYKIAGVGPAKLANLTSFGIETAADVSRQAVLAVPGFGTTNSQPLLSWRADIERKFNYNPNPNAQDQRMLASIRADIAREAQMLRSQLASGASELQKTVAAIEQRRSTSDPVVQRLYEQREQMACDLRALGMKMPSVQVTKPVRAPTPMTPPGAPNAPAPSTVYNRSGGVICPLCKKPMVKRQGRYGARRMFWGCSTYPKCRGSRSI